MGCGAGELFYYFNFRFFTLSPLCVGTNLSPFFQEYHSIHGGDYYYDIDRRTRSSIQFVALFDDDGYSQHTIRGIVRRRRLFGTKAISVIGEYRPSSIRFSFRIIVI
jgi:hypothetical protein